MALSINKNINLAESAGDLWRWWQAELANMFAELHVLNRARQLKAEISKDGSLHIVDDIDSLKGRVKLALEVDDSHIVYRKISLPAAVLANIRQVINYEFNKYFPFPVEEVHVGHELLSGPESGQIEVGIWIVKKEMIDEVADHISGSGIFIQNIEIQTSDGKTIISRAGKGSHNRDVKQVSTDMRSIIAALLLFISCLFIPVAKMNYQTDVLEKKITDLEHKAKDVIKVREKMRSMDDGLNYVVNKRSEYMPVTEVWSEVTGLVGNKAKIERLQIKDDKISLQGSAKSVQQIVQLLEAHKKFEKVSIDSPVRSIDNGKSESMKITFRAVKQ